MEMNLSSQIFPAELHSAEGPPNALRYPEADTELHTTSYPVMNGNFNTSNSSISSAECFLRIPDGNPMVNMTIPFTTFTICLVGNLFAIIFLWRSNQRSNKKQHIFYTLMMTLACCDLVSVIVTSPITFVAYMSGRCVMDIGGDALCRYSGFAMIFFGMASVAIVFAMSLERFIAIRFTLFYQRSVTTHRTRVFLLLIIVALLVLSSLPLLGFGDVAQQFPGSWCFLDWKSRDTSNQVFNFLVAILGISLMIATIVCNLIVVVRVNTARRRMRRRNSSHNFISKTRRRKISLQENQMIVLLMVMTIVFVVCYFPLLLRIIVNQVSSIYSAEFAHSRLSSWDLFAVRMASINPIIDPWVYILCRRSVFSKAVRLLKLIFLCRHDKEEFQEICLSSRDFRRRKSTRSRRSVTSTSERFSPPQMRHSYCLSSGIRIYHTEGKDTQYLPVSRMDEITVNGQNGSVKDVPSDTENGTHETILKEVLTDEISIPMT